LKILEHFLNSFVAGYNANGIALYIILVLKEQCPARFAQSIKNYRPNNCRGGNKLSNHDD